ncbi:hypothetical protein [Oligoflexus tunisiensis]|uniref:hypothetical protein n=1 Tax=Oligoflexus tunisiensis TaxID=708132 RepID=UPI00114CD952|nr:hypothetical protein [Oligoflexus tunisiensis]
MLVRRLAILLCCTGLAACEPSALRGQAQKSNTVSNDAKDENDADDEKVDPPNNISGAYLHCVTEKEPTESTPEALVGCRFDDAAGNRVPAASLAASVTYTYKALNDPEIQVYAKPLVNDARYDAVYLFFGPNRTTLLNAVQNTQVLVQLKTTVATGSDLLLGDQIRDISRDKNTIPEAPNNDYNQIRDDILIEAQQGQVTPPLP